MEEKDKGKKDDLLAEPQMSEKEITKARFKNFFYLLGILLILVFISIILLKILDKELPKPPREKNTNKWEDSYKKAEEFISKLTRTEKLNLLWYRKYEIFISEK